MIENINLNIKKGTYEQLGEHLSDIEDTDLLLGTDKDVPVPQSTDAGKSVVVNSSGEYELVNPNTANVIDIGAGQTTIGGVVYPTISKDDADEIYLKYVSGQPITLLWGTTGIATHISVIYASDISGYELHCSVHGKVAVYKWTDSTAGTIAPTISSKWMHTITIDHTTAVGSWHYQFSFVNDTPTPYTQLGQVGHYLYDNKVGIRIPATGLYTANTDKYLIAAVKSEADNMVTVEMYKVADGTANSISTGVIDVTDFVQ